MCSLGLGGQLAELCDGSGQIALNSLCQSEAPAALARGEPVTDRLGEIASLLAAARATIGSPAVIAPRACQARIWLNLH